MLCHSARKKTIKYFAGNLNNLYFQYHHLIKCNTIYNLEQRDSRELYHMQLLLKHDKPACQDYHEKMFDEYDFNWKLIYRIPWVATYETKIRIFQYILYECTYAQNLWNQLKLHLSEKNILPVLNLHSVIFGFTDFLNINYLLVNYLLLILKYNVYNSRVNNTLSFQIQNCVISQIKYIKETITKNDLNKKRKILNKWKLINHLF